MSVKTYVLFAILLFQVDVREPARTGDVRTAKVQTASSVTHL